MKDRWINAGFEEDELKPYTEPELDITDQKRIGKKTTTTTTTTQPRLMDVHLNNHATAISLKEKTCSVVCKSGKVHEH